MIFVFDRDPAAVCRIKVGCVTVVGLQRIAHLVKMCHAFGRRCMVALHDGVNGVDEVVVKHGRVQKIGIESACRVVIVQIFVVLVV